jgi:membrane protein DedA with SNARE-associated domain
MPIQTLISTYGYAAILVGTFFEGETVLVLGGFAAHRGYLGLIGVIASGFLGTLCGDQLYFYLGRAQGTKVLERRPHWRAKSTRVFNMLQQHRLLIVLTFRFLYGLRTVTPFVLGASGINPLLFLFLNAVGALLWAVSVGVSGYLFGHVFESVIGRVEKYELLGFIALSVVGALVWGIYWLRRHQTGKKDSKAAEQGFPGRPPR